MVQRGNETPAEREARLANEPGERGRGNVGTPGGERQQERDELRDKAQEAEVSPNDPRGIPDPDTELNINRPAAGTRRERIADNEVGNRTDAEVEEGQSRETNPPGIEIAGEDPDSTLEDEGEEDEEDEGGGSTPASPV